MCKSCLSDSFLRIISVLNEISSNIIKWPQANEINTIATNFKKSAGIKNVIGAIDGFSIPIKAQTADAHSYTNRKKIHSITLQAVCDYSMKF